MTGGSFKNKCTFQSFYLLAIHPTKKSLLVNNDTITAERMPETEANRDNPASPAKSTNL
jgi:hypothetical protein